MRGRELPEPQKAPDKPLPEIPELPYGEDISQYFEQVAQNYFDRFELDDKIDSLLSITLPEINKLKKLIPKLVEETRAGVWTKIDIKGNVSELSEFEPSASVFDTETFVKGSDCNSPIVGQAVGRDSEGVPSLYMWLHECFDEDIPYIPTKVSVGQNKLLVGHNFAFDRQKILEFFTMERSTNVCFCTMAMMQLIAGVDESQRWALNTDPRRNWSAQKIQQIGSKLGLVPAYEFLLKKSLPDDAKEPRNVFVKAKTFEEFREKRTTILTYSMLDVIYNLQVFKAGFPEYVEMANHRAVMAGQCSVLDAIVPHIDGWQDWLDRCDAEYAKTEKKIISLFRPYADKIFQKWEQDGEIPPLLDSLKWDLVYPKGWRRSKELPDDWHKRPRWYERFLIGDVKIKSPELGILTQAEYFYEGKWRTVYYNTSLKFHIIKNDKEIKLPNRKDPGANFGNMFGADALYLASKKEPELRSAIMPDEIFLKLLKLFDLISTYIGFRGRVVAQNKLDGLVAAQVNPGGTVSGRTMAPLYNTLPAHWDEPKIMSEIKMTSQCPDGWVFVGGDADAQEVSIAAAMGDSFYYVSGASPFSKSVLAGNKEDGTDYHSLTAKTVTGKLEVDGDERYGAKGVNFG